MTVALQGSHGKPRPAIVIQSDSFDGSSHLAVVLLTTAEIDAPLLRIPVEASVKTGLALLSHAMLDRLTTAPRDKIRGVIGLAPAATMQQIDQALALFLGLA